MTLVSMESTHTFVGDLDIQPVVRIQPDVSVGEVAIVLNETCSETLVVDTDPLSEVTERDIVAALANGASGETPLSDVSVADPVFVHPATTAEHAAMIMVASGRRSLVVVGRDRPLGVITLPCVAAVMWSGMSWIGALRVALHLEGSV